MEQRYKHQEIALAHLAKSNIFGLIMEQGTGKSRPILEDWEARVRDGRAQDLLILAPKGCYTNWIISTEDDLCEVDKWLDPEFKATVNIGLWVSNTTQSHRQALDALLYAKGPRILVMNIEALNRIGFARDYLLNFVRDHKVVGVVDESTTIAHEDAKRTTWILEYLAGRLTARRILSGLVAPESPLDLYSQYCFLDWRIIGQRSFWGFKNRYAIIQKVDFRPKHIREQMEAAGRKGKLASVIVEFRNLPELTEKIMKYSYRVTKEVLDLPPKIYQFWDVEMTEEQQRIYCNMRDIAMSQLDSGEFTSATIKLDQLGKMQHILCGHVKREDGTVEDIPEFRTNAIVEILHQHSGKAIIWAPYPQALRKIRDRLQDEFGPDSTVGFWGETTLEERIEARGRIQHDDQTRFIVSNQSVGKFGNTWTACNLVIYYANSFDNEDRQQSEDRAHRIGQTKSVTYIDIRVPGTIDEKLIRALRKKITISSTLQGDEFRKWLI
jgi:hypothetical protein